MQHAETRADWALEQNEALLVADLLCRHDIRKRATNMARQKLEMNRDAKMR